MISRMSNGFFIAALITAVAVVIVLALGVYAMIKGGEFNEKYGNKLMQARIYLQGVALACLAMAYFTGQH